MHFQNFILQLKYFNISKIRPKIILCLVGYFVSAYFLTKNERKRIKFDWQIFWGQIKNCIIFLAKKWLSKQKMNNNSSTSWQKKKEKERKRKKKERKKIIIKNKKVPQTFPSEHLIFFNLYSKQKRESEGKKLIITNTKKLWKVMICYILPNKIFYHETNLILLLFNFEAMLRFLIKLPARITFMKTEYALVSQSLTNFKDI